MIQKPASAVIEELVNFVLPYPVMVMPKDRNKSINMVEQIPKPYLSLMRSRYPRSVGFSPV
jgi:hypothetical protein